MADSPALRARRARRHRSGDHSLCRPENCRLGAAEEPLPIPAKDLDAVGLGPRGSELWRSMNPTSLGPLRQAMLLEACRIADRLDTLDRQLHGDAWLRFRHDESGAEVTVYVDRVLAEAREQATAFKGLIVELQKATAAQKPPSSSGGGVLADLAAKRAARSAGTAG